MPLAMDIDWVRQYCLSLPHTTEKVQWQDDLVFKVGGKMYVVVALEPADHWLSFKCAPEKFAELVERPGILPAPYMARAHWVSLQTDGAIPRTEIEQLLRRAYDLVFARLPKKMQAALGAVNPIAGRPKKERRLSRSSGRGRAGVSMNKG